MSFEGTETKQKVKGWDKETFFIAWFIMRKMKRNIPELKILIISQNIDITILIKAHSISSEILSRIKDYGDLHKNRPGKHRGHIKGGPLYTIMG